MVQKCHNSALLLATVYYQQCLLGHVLSAHVPMPTLVPRPLKRRRRKGLVHTAHACTGVSIATSRVTIVIVRGFCMTYSPMDDKRRVYDSIRLPHTFWGPLAHAHAMCTRPFLLLLLNGLGTRVPHAQNIMQVMVVNEFTHAAALQMWQHGVCALVNVVQWMTVIEQFTPCLCTTSPHAYGPCGKGYASLQCTFLSSPVLNIILFSD